ncbi:MAG: methyltransferase [Methylococcales bacterium]|nr:methyltransferase [Methylococcales bacterium]
MWEVRLGWGLIALAWLWAELRLTRRGNQDSVLHIASVQGSATPLWLTLGSCLSLALVIKNFYWLPIPVSYLPRQALALLLVLLGLTCRFRAIAQLGDAFHTHLCIQVRQPLICDGWYRYLRHPTYSGLLLALLGIGLALGDVLAAGTLLLPALSVVVRRITLEERLLAEHFGVRYRHYQQRTWRLVPGLY